MKTVLRGATKQADLSVGMSMLSNEGVRIPGRHFRVECSGWQKEDIENCSWGESIISESELSGQLKNGQ